MSQFYLMKFIRLWTKCIRHVFYASSCSWKEIAACLELWHGFYGNKHRENFNREIPKVKKSRKSNFKRINYSRSIEIGLPLWALYTYEHRAAVVMLGVKFSSWIDIGWKLILQACNIDNGSLRLLLSHRKEKTHSTIISWFISLTLLLKMVRKAQWKMLIVWFYPNFPFL